MQQAGACQWLLNGDFWEVAQPLLVYAPILLVVSNYEDWSTTSNLMRSLVVDVHSDSPWTTTSIGDQATGERVPPLAEEKTALKKS